MYLIREHFNDGIIFVLCQLPGTSPFERMSLKMWSKNFEKMRSNFLIKFWHPATIVYTAPHSRRGRSWVPKTGGWYTMLPAMWWDEECGDA
jgi:hypothetical protein